MGGGGLDVYIYITFAGQPVWYKVGKSIFWTRIPRGFCWWSFRWTEAAGLPGPTSGCDLHSFPQREAKGNHSFSLGLWKTGISTIYPR